MRMCSLASLRHFTCTIRDGFWQARRHNGPPAVCIIPKLMMCALDLSRSFQDCDGACCARRTCSCHVTCCGKPTLVAYFRQQAPVTCRRRSTAGVFWALGNALQSYRPNFEGRPPTIAALPGIAGIAAAEHISNTNSPHMHELLHQQLQTRGQTKP